MNEAPLPLSAAPGARGAKLCGIWSIVASLTCVGIPIGIVLAIIALVQQAKARRLAKENPDHYEMPTATGLVTGILGLAMPVLMLPFIGIVSAIAIPALLSQRARARDKAAMMNMAGRTGDLVGQWDKQREMNTAPEQIPPALETYLRQTAVTDKNPWNPAAPAFRYNIEVVTGMDQEAVREEAKGQATELGETVFVLELPQTGKPGFLAAAVRLRSPIAGEPLYSKITMIE
ncbi:MAG TPA: hypothetical protein VNV60_05510 [Holophagaceae bacterium]|nr:hypothetical protein [Holophagaceae bacterium]